MDNKETLANELKKLLGELPNPSNQSASFPEGGIGLSDLDDNLQKLLNLKLKKNQVVRISSPDIPAVDIPASENIPSFLPMIDDILVGNNVFMYGPAGTGKSTLARNLAKALGYDYGKEVEVINANQFTAPTEIIGGNTIDGKVEGKLIKAWREGKFFFVDELPKMDPNSAGLFNDALAQTADKDAVIFDAFGKAHKRHPRFAVVAAGNTTGAEVSLQYGGNFQQDASLIDRFSGSHYSIPFNRPLEKAIVFPKVFDICDNIRDRILAEEADYIMTLRTMINFNRIYILEMERVTGKKDRMLGGKTLKICLENYLGVMDPEISKRISEAVDITTFYNTYQDRGHFTDEYERRIKTS